MARKLLPLPWEAVEAQSEWLLEQFDKGLNPFNGEYIGAGKNYPGSPSYNITGAMSGAPFQSVAPASARRTPPPPPARIRNDRFSIAVPVVELDYTRRDGTTVTNYDRIEVSIYLEQATNLTKFECSYRGRIYYEEVARETLEALPRLERKRYVEALLLRRIHGAVR